MSSRTRALARWLPIALIVALLPSVGFAQKPAADEAIEEIVVTAEKRGERIQDVPLAITAFSARELEAIDARDVRDLAEQTPNLVITSPYGSSNPTIFLRGIGVNDFNANLTGATGIYTDEVYQSSPSAQLFQMFDLERVEVLRGPQGTLYGRNTTAGAINFIARRPTGELEGQGSVTIGSYNQHDYEGALGFPLGETLAGRLAFVINNRDGTTKNRINGAGKDVNDVKSWAWRGLFSFTPSDTTEWLLNVHGGANRSTSRMFQSQGLLDTDFFGGPILDVDGRPALGDAFGYVDTRDQYSGQYNNVGPEDIDLFGGSLTGKWQVGSVELTSITGYEYAKRFVGEETDASPNNILEIDWTNKSRQFSQELRAASTEAGPFQWIFGLYAFHEVLEVTNAFDQLRDLRPICEFILGDPLQCFNPADPGSFVVFAIQDYTQRTTSLAGFGQTSYDLTDRLTATAGLRYTWDRKQLNTLVGAVEPALGFPFVPTVDINDDDDWGEISGRFALDFKPNDDMLFYLSYNRGYKSGGFNGGALFNNREAEPFDPEFIDAIELGAKTSWLDNRVLFNLTGFWYNYRDLQAFTLVPAGGFTTIQVLDNASDAEVYGIEVETQFRPTPDLDILFAYGWLETEYDDFVTAVEDFSDNELTKAPHFNLNGVVQYRLDLGELGSLIPRFEYRYTHDQFFDTSNADRLSQDGYWLTNARLVYVAPDDRYEVAFWIKNMNDKVYRIDSFDLSGLGFDQIVIGEPRRLGVTVTYRFR